MIKKYKDCKTSILLLLVSKLVSKKTFVIKTPTQKELEAERKLIIAKRSKKSFNNLAPLEGTLTPTHTHTHSLLQVWFDGELDCH